MPDREKVINYAEETLSNVLPDEKDTSGIMVKVGWIREVLALLKEQPEDINELQKERDELSEELNTAVELIHKKNERIEKLLKEQDMLIAEARNEGYNEAYRSYCVEVAEEDQDLRRILPYVDRGDEDDPEM